MAVISMEQFVAMLPTVRHSRMHFHTDFLEHILLFEYIFLNHCLALWTCVWCHNVNMHCTSFCRMQGKRLYDRKPLVELFKEVWSDTKLMPQPSSRPQKRVMVVACDVTVSNPVVFLFRNYLPKNRLADSMQVLFCSVCCIVTISSSVNLVLYRMCLRVLSVVTRRHVAQGLSQCSKLPTACELFRASFSFRDLSVTLVHIRACL